MILVEDLGSGRIRESEFDAPTIETSGARLEQLGPFRQDNPGASQAATALTLGATDASAPAAFVAGRAGTLVGVVARSNADLTAGTATFRATINGTAVGSSAVLSDLVQQKITEFDAVAFVAGDLLGVTLATSSGYLPTTADHQASLLMRWAA